MTVNALAVIGAWLFACATVISKEIPGGFMLFAFVVAMILTLVLK